MKYRLLSLIILTFLFSASVHVFAQTCTNDTDDPGNCDTLWIEQENGRIPPNTSIVRHVVVYRDEVLSTWSIPIRYKNPQTDIFLDSVKLKQFNGIVHDTVIDRSSGTFLLFVFDFTGGTIPAGTDTFATLYFRTGPTWDPSIHNPLDTFTIGGPGGQGLSFVDTAGNDIQPVYNPPGNLDVEDGHKGQSAKPKSFMLSQNYPNPFNATTEIHYALSEASEVNLSVYNIMGQKVRTLIEGRQSAGVHKVIWDGKNNSGKEVASGIYFYTLRAGTYTETKKMTLLK